MSKKKAPAPTGATKKKYPDESIPGRAAGVNALRKLREAKNIPGGVVVGTVKKLYPKFSKSLLSMCERTSAYGIELAQPAMIKLYADHAPEMALKQPKKERRKLAYRIYGRLSESDWREFEQAKKADGYKTTQDWVIVAVREYLTERKKT